jgi:septum formation inhibitor-activating ATPase MinD
VPADGLADLLGVKSLSGSASSRPKPAAEADAVNRAVHEAELACITNAMEIAAIRDAEQAWGDALKLARAFEQRYWEKLLAWRAKHE